MIYTVECSFAEPTREEAWNEFYSEVKLPALISVAGFQTSQRFRAITAGCPVYLAVHTISGFDVLDSDEYRVKGGGNFARWQPDIIDWHRNVYDGIDRAPDVVTGEALILSSTGPQDLLQLGLIPRPLRAVAMEKSPARRWLSSVTSTGVPPLRALPHGTDVYVPMTPQLQGR